VGALTGRAYRLAAVLAALLIGVAIAGCGGSNKTAEAPAPKPKQAAQPTWSGDYQTGGFSQWPGHQFDPGDAKVGAGLTQVPPPAGLKYVAQFTVHAGSKVVGHGARSEVLRVPASDDAAPGIDNYWRWHVYFPASFHHPPNQSDLLLSDWHSTNSGCAVPIVLDTQDGKSVYIRIRGGATRLQSWASPSSLPPLDPGFEGRTFLDPNHACETQTDRRFTLIPHIERNHWYELTFHIKWSHDPAAGAIEAWVDGCPRIPPSQHLATLLEPRWGATYLKQGEYAPGGWQAGWPASTVYYAGTASYGRYADVWPSPPVCAKR
jgi:hypothetical protein